jgi:hypothetical protein
MSSEEQRSVATDAKPSGEQYIDGKNVAKLVHADGTVDYVDGKAIGGDLEQMPKGYYWSKAFLGTLTVSDLVRRGSTIHDR